MKKNYWVIIILIAILAILAYNFVYQEHRNIEKEIPTYSLAAKELASAFQENMTSAETKFLNRTIKISGTVSEINTSDLTLNAVIFCSFNSKNNLQNISPNTKISIKGRCIGYDDLLEQVKLDQCTILE